MNDLKNKIGIGTLQFGFDYGVANKTGKLKTKEIKEIKKIAQKNNINIIDTAHAYGDCEERLGKINFSKFDIVTKLPASKPHSNLYKWTTSSIDKALKKLKVKKVYGMHVHTPKYLLGKNGKLIYKALVDYKKKKIIQKIGVSIYTIDELNQILKKFKIDLVLLPFNIIDQRTVHKKTLERLKKMDVEIHTRSTFLQGLLTLKKNEIPRKFDKWKPLLNKWDSLAKRLKKKKFEICLQYALSNPYIDKVILGIDSAKQFKQIISKAKFLKIDVKKIDASKEIDLINPSKWPNL
jgi:aryl-alcohol dehydrogenase-like predicted oxidoreductase